jgi:hypothetical protein
MNDMTITTVILRQADILLRASIIDLFRLRVKSEALWFHARACALYTM